MSKSTRSGLVSYGEISDSEEEERASISTSPPIVFQTIVPTNSLGIPSSQQPRLFSSPPSLPKPIIQAAPTTALVDYGDDDHNDSKGDTSATVVEEFLPTFTFEIQEDNANVDEALSKDTESKNGVYMIGDMQSSLPLFLDTTNILLPPEPAMKCSKNLQNKIIGFLQKKAGSGIDLNTSLQQQKDLRNPSIYEKLVEFCNLDELGTNYPKHLYNPKEWTEESHYDNLFKDQKKECEKAKLVEHTTIEFVTGTKRPVSSTCKTETTKKQRRTKWDIGTRSGPESGGSRGTSPSGSRDRPPLLGNAPIGMQPRVLQSGIVGAQARVQANQLNKELSKAK